MAALWLGLFLAVFGSGMMQLVASGTVSAVVRPFGGGRVAGAAMPTPWLDAGSVTVAVVVENHLAARPVYGLERAAVVYEAPVEGDITRYLAIYALADAPEVIGPVRSARPYLVDWAEEWAAVLWHSGASPAAYRRLATATHVDEISSLGRYFWRDHARSKPHNLMTSGAAIRQAFGDLGFSTVGLPPGFAWEEATVSPAPRPLAHAAVSVNFRDPDYCAGFFYDPNRDAYRRFLGGAPQTGATGAEIFARTVAVPVVSARVLDAAGRLALATRRGGVVDLFVHGTRVRGRWEWQDGKTRFFDAAGNGLALPAGPVWITVATTPEAVSIPDPALPAETALRCEPS